MLSNESINSYHEQQQDCLSTPPPKSRISTSSGNSYIGESTPKERRHHRSQHVFKVDSTPSRRLNFSPSSKSFSCDTTATESYSISDNNSNSFSPIYSYALSSPISPISPIKTILRDFTVQKPTQRPRCDAVKLFAFFLLMYSVSAVAFMLKAHEEYDNSLHSENLHSILLKRPSSQPVHRLMRRRSLDSREKKESNESPPPFKATESPMSTFPILQPNGIIDLSTLGYKPRPKVFGYYFDSAATSLLNENRHPSILPTHWDNAIFELYPTKRQVRWTSNDIEGQEQLENSAYYDSPKHNPLTPYDSHPECVPMHDWQKQSFPSCNKVHEMDLTDFDMPRNQQHDQIRLLNHGYFRDVWKVREYDGSHPIALKTMRMERDFDAWMFERHRMDAMVMERMTASPLVMDIYGYCGNSGLVEYSDGGSLDDLIFEGDGEKVVTKLEALEYALDTAKAISALHTIESVNGHSAVVHADIFPNQLVWANGHFKLNDFNRCHFMYWNTTSNTESCPYLYQDYNAGEFRSPEELKYTHQTEKIDVYSMGNIFYTIMMGDYPFAEEVEKEGMSAVQGFIQDGRIPEIRPDLLESDDPIDKVLIEAIRMCHVFDYRERSSAMQVRDFLARSLREIKEEMKVD